LEIECQFVLLQSRRYATIATIAIATITVTVTGRRGRLFTGRRGRRRHDWRLKIITGSATGSIVSTREIGN
jgi:hypothetical protein